MKLQCFSSSLAERVRQLFINKVLVGSIRAILLCLLPAVMSAAPGGLDTTFGNGGMVFTPISPGTDVAHGIAVQRDGKIIVAGTSASNFTVIRYNANGTIDTTFGGGIVSTDFDSRNDEAYGVAIQADGKIVVAGTSSGDFAVARYNLNGSLDASFDGDGKVLTDFASSNDTGRAVVLQSGEKIIVAGFAGSDFAAARYNADGSLDQTFDGDGKLTTDFNSALDQANAAVLQPDGRLILAGRSNLNLALARYNSDGTLDTTFDSDGKVVSSHTNDSSGEGIDVQANGKIVVAGTTCFSCSSPRSRANATLVERYNANGTLDADFGSGGRFVGPAATQFAPLMYDVKVQPDGRILLAGSQAVFVTMRLTESGSLDPTYGSSGIAQVHYGPGATGFGTAYSIALQPDGKIVAAGNVNYSLGIGEGFAVVRILSELAARSSAFDFDGDRRADISVFRPDSGTWFLMRSQAGFSGVSWGIATDKLAPADYDGDGRADLAVMRDDPANPERSNFYILLSASGSFREERFGAATDVPVAGDWDGDGRADVGVYRDGSSAGGQSYFFYRPSSQSGVNFVTISWGATGDKPAVGDFDGDFRADAAVFRPSNGMWYVRQSSNGQSYALQFGAAGDKAVAADYDGDGRTDVAVYRGGDWFLQRSQSGFGAISFGLAGDLPVPADYDGDGKTDIAVYRGGMWYLLQSGNGFASAMFGTATDKPIPNTFIY